MLDFVGRLSLKFPMFRFRIGPGFSQHFMGLALGVGDQLLEPLCFLANGVGLL